MRSVPLALTWELLQRGRWILIAAMLAANIFPAAVFTALRHEGALDPTDASLIVMHVVMMQMNMFIFGAAICAAQGDPIRLYALPVRTTSLVAWHLLPAMALMALELVVSTAVLNAVFHLGWPLWGPALFLALALAAIDAVRWWLTEKSPWFPIVLGLVAAILGCWHKARYGPAFSQPTHLWLQVTPGEVVTMLGIGLVAYWAAIAGVARNRRGDPLPSLGIIAWFERTFDTTSPVAFRTPKQAQFWFEWRRKGWWMPAANVGLLSLGFCTWLIFSRDPEQLFGGAIGVGGLLLLVGLVGGVSIGNSGPSDANFEMGNFLATRPMTNTDMARTVLKTAAMSVLIAWAIWAAACLVLYVILRAAHLIPLPALPQELGWWYFPGTLLGCWIVATFLASVGLTGRSSPFVQIFCALVALFLGLMLFSKYALSHQAQQQLGKGLLAASGLACLLGTGWAFVAARRRSLIGTPTICIGAATWLALCTLVVVEWTLRPSWPLAAYMAAVGLLALVAAPLAAAPLALAWNRNR